MNEPEFGVSQTTGNRLKVIEDLIAKLPPGYVNALEVGSYEGRSALAISAAIGARGGPGGHLVCVDPWKPYLGNEPPGIEVMNRMDADLESGAVFERFKQNIKHAHPLAQISHRVGSLGEFNLPTRDFNFVYIDGCHRYSAVKRDLEIARYLVVHGGILCGDDLERQGCDAAKEAEPVCERDASDDWHPGVTRAVWETFGQVWCEDGVWAVRRALWSWEVP